MSFIVGLLGTASTYKSQLTLAFIIGLVILGFYWFYTYTIEPTTTPVKGLPQLPGSIAIWGNLKQLGSDHPTALQQLSLKYKFPVFQCLFGIQRIVFVNSFDSAMEWFIKNQTALIDRPLFYTFHKLVSTSQGLTIGTSPWDETCKKRRLNVQRYMTTPAIKERANLIDVESYSMLRDLYSFTKSNGPVYPYKYTQRLALNFTTMLSYATRFDDIDTPLLGEILDMVKTIT
ncbi:unnamed protein product [Ambrosiozyma monospora]|uniref:Unnamed protein product n=1 Tax=Ambrosiozyma monospora TaxID=43982 RepID=A0ACB5T2C6_AMBMO|nr:unnamed protein product [Ambrosiozyma monospora]